MREGRLFRGGRGLVLLLLQLARVVQIGPSGAEIGHLILHSTHAVLQASVQHSKLDMCSYWLDYELVSRHWGQGRGWSVGLSEWGQGREGGGGEEEGRGNGGDLGGARAGECMLFCVVYQ